MPPEINLQGVLAGFADSSWGEPRASAGHIITYNGAPIAFLSKRLPTTPISSCEGEILALARAAPTLLNLRQVLEHMTGRKLATPTTLATDNQSAALLSHSAHSNKAVRHVALRIAFVREQTEAGALRVSWIPTDTNPADILTKQMSTATKHHKIRACLIDH